MLHKFAAVVFALLFATSVLAQGGGTPLITGGSFTAGGSSNQTQYYGSGGQFAGFTWSGDATVVPSTGVVTVGQPFLEKFTTFTSTSGSAAFNMPQGATPSSPVNGDCWMTSSGFFCQVASATVGPFAAAGGASGCPTATPCTVQQTINDATANRYGLVFGPATLASGTTGHGINIVDTVNDASAVDGVLWFSNTTCTACTNTTYLMDMQVASSSVFKVSNLGTTTITGTMAIGPTSQYQWVGRGAFSSPGAGGEQLGPPDAASAVAQTLSAQSVIAGTSNVAGTNFIIQGSRGTGTGAGGQILIKTASAGTTGTAQNAAVTALAIDQTQYVIAGAGTPTCGTGCASIDAGATNQRMIVNTSTAVLSIAVNFSATLTTAPVCTATEVAGTPIAIGFNAVPTTGGYTLTAASALTATKIMVLCG